jgi:hypothetical protein
MHAMTGMDHGNIIFKVITQLGANGSCLCPNNLRYWDQEHHSWSQRLGGLWFQTNLGKTVYDTLSLWKNSREKWHMPGIPATVGRVK